MVERLAGTRRGDLLDIGCGDGDFLRAMKRRGGMRPGVELAHEKRAKLQGARTDGDQTGRLADPSSGSLDAVTLWHAWNICKPLDALQNVRRLLKANGICVHCRTECGIASGQEGTALIGSVTTCPGTVALYAATLAMLLGQAGFAVGIQTHAN